MLKTKCYSFHAKNEENKSLHGVIHAPNKAMAHFLLVNMGLTHIRRLNIHFGTTKKSFHLNTKNKHYFFSQLSLMINAGLSLIDSLKIMQQDAFNFKIKYIVYLILTYLSTGKYLSESIENLPGSSFSKTEILLIRSAEISGTLDKTLAFIEKKLKNKLITQQKIASSLMYPIITLILGLMLSFVIFKFIIPQFATLFMKSQHDLPWLTQIILGLSKHIGKFFLGFILCFLLSIYAIKWLRKTTWCSDKFQEKCIRNFPVAGKMCLLIDRVNFCHTFSMLLAAGVPIIETFQRTNEQILLPHTKNQLKLALNELATGKNLSAVLKRTYFFPSASLQMMLSAEHTGKLDEIFTTMGQQFSQELSHFAENLGKIIEPFIIILLGVIIGVIVIAVYMPIFQLGSLY